MFIELACLVAGNYIYFSNLSFREEAFCVLPVVVVVVVISKSLLLRRQHFGAFKNEKERSEGKGKKERIEHLSFRGKLGAMKHELDLRTRQRTSERNSESNHNNSTSNSVPFNFLPARSFVRSFARSLLPAKTTHNLAAPGPA